MPEYLDDPSVLTKDKLKSELLAHNVELPSGNPTKDVYVQLYLKNLTVQNKKNATLDAFSSDEELPPPVVSNRSRSSGRKATRKTDKARPDDLDVTELTAEGLKDELLKYGVDAGPIVASTRKLYEKKLQKLLDDGPPQAPEPQVLLAEIDVNHNGNSDSDRYSDKEEEETSVPEPEPEAEPEPVPEPVPEPAPVAERPVRSRGKTPVIIRTRSSQHNKIVPRDLRPVLTDQVRVESNRKVHHRPVSPAKAESPSVSSRSAQRPAGEAPSYTGRARCVALTPRHPPPVTTTPVTKHPEALRAPESPRWKLHEEELGIPPPKLVKAAPPQPGALLNTTLQEVEKIAASEQTPRADERDVLKEMFPNDINTPTGITATCRRPIRGAAGRPVISSDLWNNENFLLSPKSVKTTTSSSSYTESHSVHRVTNLPPSTPSSSSLSSTSSSSSSRLVSAAPPTGQAKAARRSLSLWIKLFLLAIVAAFLFFVYQAMETNAINPFGGSDTEQIGSDSAAPVASK